MSVSVAPRSRSDVRPRSLAPDIVERIIAAGSVLMLVAMLTALGRGVDAWARIPAIVWLHLSTIAITLALTPALMLKKRGTRWHRRAGWAWVAAMGSTAFLSLFIGGFSNGRFSWIHILSVATLTGVVALARAARAHNVRKHRTTVRSVAIGALLIAGVFTFLPHRTLGHLLLG